MNAFHQTDPGPSPIVGSFMEDVIVKRPCDRVAIIHDGKLVKQGTMDERTGSETLEDVSYGWRARTVRTKQLDWL